MVYKDYAIDADRGMYIVDTDEGIRTFYSELDAKNFIDTL